MPSNPYDCTDTDPLFQLYEQVRDYLLNLLERLRNALNDLWDYFAQVRGIPAKMLWQALRVQWFTQTMDLVHLPACERHGPASDATLP